MDKNNDFENAVEVTSVTTEHPKSKNRIKKRHESKLRKTLRIIKNIICWGVLAILVLTVIVFMGSKVNGKTPSLFGYSVLRVSTGSMQPELMIGDVILGKSVDDPTALKVGDIITYRGSGQTEGLLVTHKVVVAPYKTADGTYKLQTKGIANDAPDPATIQRSIKIFRMDEKISSPNGIFDSPIEVNMVERMLYINRNGKPTK